jgi:hypothetical protein
MSVSDLQLGPCQVLFGVEDAEADLGRTEGDVVVTFSTDLADLMSDQFGTRPEDQVITGQGALIKVPLAEITISNLALALNQSASGGGGLVEGTRLVGTKLRSKANSLLLKKYVNGSVSSDREDWLRFPTAAPQGNFEQVYGKNGQRIIEVNFIAFEETTTNDLYYIGDESES